MAKQRFIPEKFNVITSPDDIGAILDISRITGEDLYSYKKRILESSERLANSSYEGLINGINRELGLERVKVINLDTKKILQGRIDNPAIDITLDTLTDIRMWAGTIDGVLITAIGNKFTVDTPTWVIDELVGLSLDIDGTLYDIQSNTEDVITFDGDVSSTAGLSYSISAQWELNKFVGLALYIGKRKYEILENTNNIIRVDRNISDDFGFDYYVTALRPRVEITSSRIILYKEYLNEENFQLDIEIPLRESSTLHQSVVEKIKTESQFFQAEDLIPLSEGFPTFTLKQQDSDVSVTLESVPGAKFFKLGNKNIKDGTVKFSETDIFFREVGDIDSISSGPYYFVDYNEGIVRAKSAPNGFGTVSYTYSDLPLEIEAVPAAVTAFVDEDAETFLFAQKDKILYDDVRDKQISSQPKSNMIEYISELLKVTDQTWGE